MSALSEVINEFVNTERSYVKRLRALKNEYADPLRQYSKKKTMVIFPQYEANTLFGNIDNLVPVNEAFLADLEKMVAPVGSLNIGDVALRHFKELRGFEHYKQYYVKREEAQSIFEREMMKKSSGFAEYIDVNGLLLYEWFSTDVLFHRGSNTRTQRRVESGCANCSWTRCSGYQNILYSFAQCSNSWDPMILSAQS